MKLIGVDVGGTFTDIVFTDTVTGRTIIHKSPTTPDDPSQGVVTGVGEVSAARYRRGSWLSSRCLTSGLQRVESLGEVDQNIRGAELR
ncbi:MAG: hydantoinase/oxoprolinase N-terminal domain-containing protein [Candidatus Entotheonellia bacterium]